MRMVWSMSVDLITESLLIEPSRIFIIPENRDLHVLNGECHLQPISKPRGWPDVITVFLRSLTEYWDGKLIAVIVSGYDGDGAAALCGIKEIGGITILRAGASILSCRQKISPEKLCKSRASKCKRWLLVRIPVASSVAILDLHH
ncbi:MAG: hypothetical protein A2V62_12880 [Nitrospirae bacterium RBG_19FT_COMBO_58_9]|nr:MAG: hypothetical protein A2V62_12880 [Nitrospirae bacterium RBG_19FT_COMBO_58_9]